MTHKKKIAASLRGALDMLFPFDNSFRKICHSEAESLGICFSMQEADSSLRSECQFRIFILQSGVNPENENAPDQPGR